MTACAVVSARRPATLSAYEVVTISSRRRTPARRRHWPIETIASASMLSLTACQSANAPAAPLAQTPSHAVATTTPAPTTTDAAPVPSAMATSNSAGGAAASLTPNETGNAASQSSTSTPAKSKGPASVPSSVAPRIPTAPAIPTSNGAPPSVIPPSTKPTPTPAPPNPLDDPATAAMCLHNEKERAIAVTYNIGVDFGKEPPPYLVVPPMPQICIAYFKAHPEAG